MYKIIVAGSRSFNNYSEAESILNHIIQNYNSNDVVIVSGGARGADKLGELFAMKKGLKLKVFPANWNKHGKAAGPIRNQEMAEFGTHCIVFWDGKSRGSLDMMKRAKKESLKLLVYNFSEKTIKIF